MESKEILGPDMEFFTDKSVTADQSVLTHPVINPLYHFFVACFKDPGYFSRDKLPGSNGKTIPASLLAQTALNNLCLSPRGFIKKNIQLPEDEQSRVISFVSDFLFTSICLDVGSEKMGKPKNWKVRDVHTSLRKSWNDYMKRVDTKIYDQYENQENIYARTLSQTVEMLSSEDASYQNMKKIVHELMENDPDISRYIEYLFVCFKKNKLSRIGTAMRGGAPSFDKFPALDTRRGNSKIKHEDPHPRFVRDYRIWTKNLLHVLDYDQSDPQEWTLKDLLIPTVQSEEGLYKFLSKPPFNHIEQDVIGIVSKGELPKSLKGESGHFNPDVWGVIFNISNKMSQLIEGAEGMSAPTHEYLKRIIPEFVPEEFSENALWQKVIEQITTRMDVYSPLLFPYFLNSDIKSPQSLNDLGGVKISIPSFPVWFIYACTNYASTLREIEPFTFREQMLIEIIDPKSPNSEEPTSGQGKSMVWTKDLPIDIDEEGFAQLKKPDTKFEKTQEFIQYTNNVLRSLRRERLRRLHLGEKHLQLLLNPFIR